MSSEKKVLTGAGLRGQVAGKTYLSTVGGGDDDLRYRGYRIQDLAAHASYEEVAWLILRGALPTASELASYEARLAGMRELPLELRNLLETIPATAHPMDVMRSGVSYLGNLEGEADDFSDQMDKADRILATLPAIVTYWHRFVTEQVRVETASYGGGQAAYFLRLLHDREPEPEAQACMDASLSLYAEHEFNASTFTGRVVASTLSDMHSAIVAAIGALRGPLHGGANEKAHELVHTIGNVDAVKDYLDGAMERKDKIMGFGHAIYASSDPRNALIYEHAKILAKTPEQRQFLAVSEAVVAYMWQAKKLFPNADFYHASAYDSIGIPRPLFTPLFVCGRMAGWAAHVIEQRSDNRIIRPIAEYLGEGARAYLPIDQR